MKSHVLKGIQGMSHHGFPGTLIFQQRLTGKCVAGGLKGIHCGNNQYTPNFSAHDFPNRHKDHKQHMQWVHFVRRYRPNWSPTSHQVVIAAFTFKTEILLHRDIATTLGMTVTLKSDAIPGIGATSNREALKYFFNKKNA